MRILILSQFFYPDTRSSVRLVTDLALDLAAAGHAVTLLTGSATAGGGERRAAAAEPWRGIEIRRVFCGRFDPQSRLRRAACFLRFLWGALLRLLLWRGQLPEVVLATGSQPRTGSLASLFHRLRGVPYVAWLPSGPCALAWRRQLLGPLAGATLLIAGGDAAAEAITAAGVPASALRIIHNWATGDMVVPVLPDQNPVRRNHALKDRFVLLCHADWQSPETLHPVAEAMRRLPADTNIRLVLLGDAPFPSAFKPFESLWNPHQVLWFAMPPRNEIAFLLSAADLGLIPAHDRCSETANPAFPYELMAAGRGWIALADPHSEAQRLAERHDCGWTSPPQDPAALARLILQLAQSPDLTAAAGRRARSAFVATYDRPLAVRRIEDALRTAAPASPARARTASV